MSTVGWTYQRVYPAALGDLSGSNKNNGFIGFGELPPDIEACPPTPAKVSQLYGFRPLLASLNYTAWGVVTPDGIPLPNPDGTSIHDVQMYFTEQRIPAQSPALATAAGNPRWAERIFVEPGVHTINFGGLLVPVDSDNGNPYAFRVFTLGRNDETDSQIIVDWDWNLQRGSNVSNGSLHNMLDKLLEKLDDVAEAFHPGDHRLMERIRGVLEDRGETVGR